MPVVPSVLRDIFAGAIRLILLWAVGWFAKHNIIISVDETAVAEVVAFIGGLAWLIWSKVKQHRIKNTQAASAAGTTEKQAEEIVKEGAWASALTKPTEQPVITQNKPPAVPPADPNGV